MSLARKGRWWQAFGIEWKRRAFVRFFACEQDLSLDPPDTPLPEAVAAGQEPFLIIGAIAGG